MDAAELKALWVSTVRGLLQVPDYRVGKNWNSVFDKVSDWLTANEEIDPEKFVRIQVKHLIATGGVKFLYPNVLSGENAAARYYASPNDEDDGLTLAKRYAQQAQCFTAVCQHMGEEFALAGRVNDYTPLFLGFMRWSTQREVSPELRADAKAELLAHPSARDLFPAAYIKEIDA